MAKVSKNLSLDEAALARGERYSALHDTNLSRIVSDFLIHLPVDEPTEPLPPTVRRLIGIGVLNELSDAEGHESQIYHDHLDSKRQFIRDNENLQLRRNGYVCWSTPTSSWTSS